MWLSLILCQAWTLSVVGVLFSHHLQPQTWKDTCLCLQECLAAGDVFGTSFKTSCLPIQKLPRWILLPLQTFLCRR